MTTQPITLAPALGMAVKIRLLGPLEFLGSEPPSAKLIRRVAALLAVNVGATVRRRDIARELWDNRPPVSWDCTVQTYILRLRNGIDAARREGDPPAKEVIVTRPAGYILAGSAGDVDARRFLAYADQAAREFKVGLVLEADDTLLAAFSLWRGPCLVDVECGPLLTEWADRVEETRRTARSLRFQVDLRLGRHRDVLGEIRAEWRADVTFEPTAALLMLALYRSDRQRDALQVFMATRAALVEEHGLEPGPALQRLQAAILAGDPALELEAK